MMATQENIEVVTPKITIYAADLYFAVWLCLIGSLALSSFNE